MPVSLKQGRWNWHGGSKGGGGGGGAREAVNPLAFAKTSREALGVLRF